MAVSFSAFWLGLTIVASAILGVAIAALVGAWKEWVYDKARPESHTVDGWDFRATALGGVAGDGVMVLLRAYL